MVEKLAGRDMIYTLAIARKVNEVIDSLEAAGTFKPKEVEKLPENARPQQIATKINEVIDKGEEKEILEEPKGGLKIKYE
jgi:hypothetical protein